MGGGFGSQFKGGGKGAPAPPSGGFGASFASAPAAPKKSGGGGGFFGHLFHDAESTLSNIPSGVAHLVQHPIGTAKDIGRSYAQTYGPLVHGKFGKFFHGVEQHPLGPILDLATLATLGAGGAAKAGEILGKAGVVSDTGKFANLGKAGELTVPDFAKRAGQAGEDIAIKPSSANPLIRARQNAVNAGLNKLPELPGKLGAAGERIQSARAVKALSKGPEKAAAALTIEGQPFKQAFEKLTGPEKVAWHLSARAVDPAAYRAFLEGQPKASAAMLKILANPKVADLVAAPSKNLADALDKGRALSDRLGAAKVQAGHISEQSAAESPYRLLRLINGAHIVPDARTPALQAELGSIEKDWHQLVGKAMEGKPGDYKGVTALQNGRLRKAGHATVTDQMRGRAEENLLATIKRNPEHPAVRGWEKKLARAQAIRDELNRRGEESLGFVEPKTTSAAVLDRPGRELPVLMKELEQQGKHQPFYVPDSAETRKGAGSMFRSKPTGLAEPAVSGASKQNLGVLASRGMLAVNENPLSREFARFRNHTEGSLLHDELVKHAAELPKGEPLPHGVEFLKLNRGEATAPYTERIGGEFEHALDPGTADKVLTKDEAHPDIATKNGNRLVVPSSVREILQNRSLTYHGTLHHLLYNQPTSVWKHLVLGLRPAFFGNITVGNSILGALQMAPGHHGFAGWINQVVPGADKVLGSKLSKATYEKVFPEQAAGTFGHSTGFTSNKAIGSASRAAGVAGKAKIVGAKAYQGVMPATIAYENVLRRAMAEGWAKATPEVRAAMKKSGGDVNAALDHVAKAHPQVITDISKRIDDALGNYRTYNAFEQKIRQLIPFYGWDRHIVRSVARLVSERPGILDALTKVGGEGQSVNDKTLGPLPSFLQGSIKLGHEPGVMGAIEPGRVPLLTTHSLNPFNSAADLLRFAQALTSGQAGAHSEELSSGLNPIIQSLIEQLTGRSLLTGGALAKSGPSYGPIGNTVANIGGHLPQSTLVSDLIRSPTTKPTSLYQKDLQTALAAYLGAPIKKTNLTAAARLAQLEGKPAR